MSNFKKYTANPFYMSNSLMILLFFTGWGIWWSFFQIWLTTKQVFQEHKLEQSILSIQL